MKQITAQYVFPFVLALALLYASVFHTRLNDLLFAPPNKIPAPLAFHVIASFGENPAYEQAFLESDSAHPVIYLLGSSELLSNSAAIPYRFINSHFGTKIKAVGHAGNQCFSIYCQLLANAARLNQAPVVFVISPGWFESKTSKGTSSDVFLEFNSESFLKSIYRNDSDTCFQYYAGKRLAELYPEFSSPNLPLRLLNFKARAAQSPLHALCFYPLLKSAERLLKLKEQITGTGTERPAGLRLPIKAESVSIAWDSLYACSKAETNRKVTNNTLGINDAYYTEYIHGKTGHMEPVPASLNQELADFRMLLQLVKAKHMQASFILSPLNPFYYKNLAVMRPTLDEVEAGIKQSGFPFLNLFVSDTTQYEKPVLHDVMHMADYGWYQADRFIVSTYHLTR